MRKKLIGPVLFCAILAAVSAAADLHSNGTSSAGKVPVATSPENQDYVLGPGDQITIWAIDLDELSQKLLRIGNSGRLTVPLAGTIQAAGMTVSQLEAAITERLRSVQKNPQVTVNITEYQSQPISVIGAVNKPGIHQLEGRRSLIEVLSAAGGLNNDAGYRVKITRRMEWGAIPLPGAVQDGQFSTAEVSVRELMEARNPEVNIQIKPRDVISVPRARTVYVIGEVEKAGGYVLGEEENMSVLQALSMAGGLTHTAKPQSAKILRSVNPSEPRVEEAVDLSKILSGKNKDLPMNANDILFVPNNKPKSVAIRVIEAAVNTGTGVIVFRGSR